MVLGPDGETVLTGPVIDPAALHGILNWIRDLGVPLLSVKRLSADEGGPSLFVHVSMASL